MSLLWNDRLLVALHPHRVTLLRLSAGWRPTVKAKTLIECQPGNTLPKWQPALTALAETLQHREWQRARVDVVLSQHFVRATVVPPNLALRSREEEDTFARHCLIQVHGDMPGDWQILQALARPGQPKLACAVERALLDTLTVTIAETGNRLAAIRPHFVAAYRARQRQLAKQHAWLAVLEPDRCSLMQVDRGRLLRISSRRMCSAPAIEIPAMLAQEQLLSPSEHLPDQLLLATFEHHRIDPPPNSLWAISTLPTRFPTGMSPHTDAPYGMALEAFA